MRALLLCVLSVACSPATSPEPISIDLSSAVPSLASPIQVEWWTALEICSGITRSWREPTYYVLMGKSDVVVNGHSYWAYWVREGNKIILSEAWASNTKLVKHEMMHALLQDGTHPTKYFNGVCGDLSYPGEATN
jgi:hypothetical protein